MAGAATPMGDSAEEGGVSPVRLAEPPGEMAPARAPAEPFEDESWADFAIGGGAAGAPSPEPLSPTAAGGLTGVAALALQARTLRAWISRSPAECREQLLEVIYCRIPADNSLSSPCR